MSSLFDILKYLINPTPERAVIVLIHISGEMGRDELFESEEYLKAVREVEYDNKEEE